MLVLMLMLTLDDLGIEIKPLLAGLGIGGSAVALAAQNILGDLFASLSITLDRPFVSGEQIIMPNSNLLASRVRPNDEVLGESRPHDAHA